MKSVAILFAVLAFVASARARKAVNEFSVPELHAVQDNHVFTPQFYDRNQYTFDFGALAWDECKEACVKEAKCVSVGHSFKPNTDKAQCIGYQLAMFEVGAKTSKDAATDSVYQRFFMPEQSKFSASGMTADSKTVKLQTSVFWSNRKVVKRSKTMDISPVDENTHLECRKECKGVKAYSFTHNWVKDGTHLCECLSLDLEDVLNKIESGVPTVVVVPVETRNQFTRERGSYANIQ